ncbi:Metallophosphoesterase domain-containing protein [Cynara cardunculus var. scolymus]|uniref:Purple acid phosphatase n=1 Tax=Cynara cardunculus var. scolymus TaxID=59895 RepID=A0A124SEJ3_CYNCS|nr:Metallophosphoesterase domain-containing protein [Cynara cardunculus var. scolymus]
MIMVVMIMSASAQIPTTLDGPFKPVTRKFDPSLRLGSDDLPMNHPRLKKNVTSNFPEQIALALSSPNSMWVSWITGDAQIGKNVTPLDPSTVASEVWYGDKSGKYSKKRTGVSMIYSQLYPFEGLLNYTSGIIHHVKIDGSNTVVSESELSKHKGMLEKSARNKGLEPGLTYYYKCGDSSIGAMSDERFFETLPLPSPNTYPRRIAVVGDLGLTANTTTTIDHLIKNDPSLVLMVGDLSYANQFMEPLISRVPMMVVEGNHEIEPQADGVTFESYLKRFAVPSNESGSNSNFYYSVDAGGVHFIMLGAYIDYNRTGAQYSWLQKDLSQLDRSVTPWLVAAWHSPWYNSYSSHYQEFECMRLEMEELLYHYRVHAYERMNRVYNYSLEPCGPVYITIGDGGNIEKVDVDHADEPGKCPSPGDNIPEFGGVVNSTYALWTWHRNQDIYKANSTGDQIYIVRQPELCSVSTQHSQTRPSAATGFGVRVSSSCVLIYLIAFTWLHLL